MSFSRTTIFSPDSELVGRLQSALDEAGFGAPAVAQDHYPSAAELTDAIASEGPNPPVVFVDMQDEQQALRLVRKALAKNSKAVMIAANGERRLSALVRAKEAGAWGYIVHPIDLAPLAEPLRVKAVATRLPRRVVSFLPAQGGNGSSTVATHVATSIAEAFGNSTVLLD